MEHRLLRLLQRRHAVHGQLSPRAFRALAKGYSGGPETLSVFRHIELEDENSATVIKATEPYLPFLESQGITSHLHLRSDQLMDSARVRWMAESGVVRIHVGVESGNERVLNQVMHKHESVETHYVAARNMAAAGIEEVATAIVANPT